MDNQHAASDVASEKRRGKAGDESVSDLVNAKLAEFEGEMQRCLDVLNSYYMIADRLSRDAEEPASCGWVSRCPRAPTLSMAEFQDEIEARSWEIAPVSGKRHGYIEVVLRTGIPNYRVELHLAAELLVYAAEGWPVRALHLQQPTELGAQCTTSWILTRLPRDRGFRTAAPNEALPPDGFERELRRAIVEAMAEVRRRQWRATLRKPGRTGRGQGH